MSRRDGSQVVTITTLGQRPNRSPGRRISVGGALATGVAVLVVYLIVSAIFHIIAAAAVWIPSILVAGYVARFAAQKGVHGWPRFAIGIVALVAVHIALVAGLHAIGL